MNDVCTKTWMAGSGPAKGDLSVFGSSLPEVETIGGAVALDPAGGRVGGMRRHDQRAAVGMLLHQPLSAGARARGVGAGHCRPVGPQALQWMMQDVADKKTAIAAGAGVDHDIARGMAGIGLKPETVVERVIVADQERLVTLDHRQNAVAKGAGMRR